MPTLRLSVVLPGQRITDDNGQYSRLGFVLVLVCVCARFRLWPVVKAKRPGVPSKAHEPVYTRPYACPSQHHNSSIRDVVTMPEMVTLDVGELVS